MNGTGDEFLASAAFTCDQDHRIRGRYLFHFRENLSEDLALANNLLVPASNPDFFLQIIALSLKLVL